MKDELQLHGVELLALSKDRPAEAAAHRKRDGLSFRLLADPELRVIRRFGLEHHRAVEFSQGAFVLFGIPLAVVPSFKTMAVPTTLLVDESGTIKWIDQTDDYRLRSDKGRVMGEVRAAFPLK